jgi:ankyrin repeat protein
MILKDLLRKSTGFVQMLLGREPELAKTTDKLGWTPLHYAASVNNIKAVKMLLERHKLSAYVADSSGLCPVHVAAKLGYRKVVIEIFKHCPDSDELLDCQGRNLVHLAVTEKRTLLLMWICRSNKLKKAMNAQDDQGNTPLHLAVKTGHMGTFSTLMLSKRTHLSWTNKDGFTPLDIASTQKKDGFTDYWQVLSPIRKFVL